MVAHIRPGRTSRHSKIRVVLRITVLTALLAFGVYPSAAQTAPPAEATTPDSPKPFETGTKPDAAPEATPDGASEVAPAAAPQYTGPAVLSRANQPSLGSESVITLEPFFYVNQIYDTGLSLAASHAGTLPQQAVAGVESGFGLRANHRWKRITLNVNYEGNYRQYTQQTGLDGTNQYLRATALIQLKRHLELALRQTVASVIQDGISLSLQPLNLSDTLPSNEPYDNRAKLFDSQAVLTYQKSRRLSFTSSIGSSRIQRDLAPLVGADAITATGDVEYLLTAHATMGLDYSFSHYGYTTFGTADFSTVSGNFSWRFTRTVDLAMQLGMSHGAVTGLAIVPLDPGIVALVGAGNAIQVSHQTVSSPAVRAQISKHWHYASAEASYQKGISPGNGLLLTSSSTSYQAGFHYSPSHVWTFSVQAGRTSMQTLAGLTANSYTSSYTGYVMDASVSRSLKPSLQFVARFDARPFSYLGPSLQTRTFYRSTIGFVFTPRAVPVVLR